jgi:hypothetical protein
MLSSVMQGASTYIKILTYPGPSPLDKSVTLGKQSNFSGNWFFVDCTKLLAECFLKSPYILKFHNFYLYGIIIALGGFDS